jgi:hypothetical protein
VKTIEFEIERLLLTITFEHFYFWLTITANHLVADKAQIAEQLMIMGFAVGQTALFIMAMSQEGLFALGANEVLLIEWKYHDVNSLFQSVSF